MIYLREVYIWKVMCDKLWVYAWPCEFSANIYGVTPRSFLFGNTETFFSAMLRKKTENFAEIWCRILFLMCTNKLFRRGALPAKICNIAKTKRRSKSVVLNYQISLFTFTDQLSYPVAFLQNDRTENSLEYFKGLANGIEQVNTDRSRSGQNKRRWNYDHPHINRVEK